MSRTKRVYNSERWKALHAYTYHPYKQEAKHCPWRRSPCFCWEPFDDVIDSRKHEEASFYRSEVKNALGGKA